MYDSHVKQTSTTTKYILNRAIIMKVLLGGLNTISAVFSTSLNKNAFKNITESLKSRDLFQSSNYSNIVVIFIGKLAFVILLWIQNFLLFNSYCTENLTFVICCYKWILFNYCFIISVVHSLMFSSLITVFKHQFACLNKTFLSENEKTKQNLYEIKKTYTNLINDFKQLENIFSFSLLFKFLYDMFVILCGIYISAFEYDTASSHIMLHLVPILIIIFELLDILLNCKLVCSEYSKTGAVLHKIFNNYEKQKDTQNLVSRF